MIEIQWTGLMLGMIIGVIMGGGTAFYVTWKVDSSQDQVCVEWRGKPRMNLDSAGIAYTVYHAIL